MFKVIIEDFETEKDAENFIHWFEGSGEQQLCLWTEGRDILTNMQKTFPLEWNGNEVKLFVTTYMKGE
jgi:hypothetical protein